MKQTCQHIEFLVFITLVIIYGCYWAKGFYYLSNEEIRTGKNLREKSTSKKPSHHGYQR